MRWLAALAAVGLLALSAGCDQNSPVQANVDWDDLPLVNTPEGVIERLEWRWNHRDTTRYGELFTADFEFVFQCTDSSGNGFENRVLTRALEIAAVQALLAGTPSAPEAPPDRVTLTFQKPLVVLPDPRPGRSATAHRVVAAPMLLRLENPDFEVSGGARFYLVRGDSAAWPADLPHVGPDSSRWFIERWEDFTAGDATAVRSAMPGRIVTLGKVKALYLPHTGAGSFPCVTSANRLASGAR